MEVIRKELETGTIMFRPLPDDGNPFNTGITAINPIPDGFELLGISDQLTEEDLVGVMPKSPMYDDKFCSFKEHYSNIYFFYEETALEAFNSLKESLGIVDVNRFPKPTETGLDSSLFEMQQFFNQDKEYSQEQSKVRKHIVLFEAKK